MFIYLISVKGQVSEDDKSKVDQASDSMLQWLEANPSATVEEIQAKLQELESTVNPIIEKLRSSDPGSADDGASKFY